MASKTSKFCRRAQLPEDIPEYLGDFMKKERFLLNGTIEDFGWYGDDGSLDPQPIIHEITNSIAALRIVVDAVVRANSSSTSRSTDRVEMAMRALLGAAGRKGRRDLSTDEPILQRMAVEFLQGFYGFKEPHQSLNALSNRALDEDPGFAGKGEDEKENRRLTICRKFGRYRDHILLMSVCTTRRDS